MVEFQLGGIKSVNMILSNDEYFSNSLIYTFESEIGERVKYTSNIGMKVVSVANANLDGSGTLETILIPTSTGTLIKNITIKAIGNTTEGMIRIFSVGKLSANRLLMEVYIPATIATSTDAAFMITLEVDFFISTTLKASTQNAESFVIIAEGLDVFYP